MSNSQLSTHNSQLIPPGYKQTEVGVIPEDWEIPSIQELLDRGAVVGHLDGNHGELYPRSHEFKESGVPYITANDLCGRRVDFSNCKHLSEDRARRFRKGVAKNGDVLFAHNATVGPTALLSTELDCVILSTTATYFRCNPEKLLNSYLLYALQSAHFVGQYRAVMAQSTRNQVPITAQRKLSIPLPPTKAEQEAIAEVLSDADALIESLEQLLTKKRLLKQGAMQEFLTGKKRLPGFSGEWEVKRLGEILSRLSNGAVYKATNSSGLQITRIETIADGTIDYYRTGTAEATAKLENYKLISGDILFSHINSLDHIGKVAQFLSKRDLYHGMNLLLLRANKETDSRFLYFWFTSAPARRIARNMARQAVNQASINTTELKTLEILLPPLPEQVAIAAILSDMDAEITALEAKLVKARQLKQGMMQELLTGRIRLVESGK